MNRSADLSHMVCERRSECDHDVVITTLGRKRIVAWAHVERSQPTSTERSICPFFLSLIGTPEARDAPPGSRSRERDFGALRQRLNRLAAKRPMRHLNGVGDELQRSQ